MPFSSRMMASTPRRVCAPACASMAVDVPVVVVVVVTAAAAVVLPPGGREAHLMNREDGG